MNLKKVKAVEDRGDYFAVTHETHGTFKVAKRGLDKMTHGSIQAMCQGGMVKGYSGEDAAPVDQVVTPEATPLPVPGAPQNWPPPGTPEDWAKASGPGFTEPDPTYGQDTQPGQLHGPAPFPVEPMPPSQAPELQARLGQGAGQPPPAPPAAVVKPPAMPSASPILKDFDTQAAALKAGADAAAQEEAEKAKAWDAFNRQDEARNAAFEDTMKARQAEDDQLSKAVASSTIKPHRLWTNMSTAGKAGNIIAGALAGMAQGLMHTNTNTATDALNRLMDEDVEAQKLELGQKENQLARNLKATGDIRMAEQMYRAQRLAGLQGQLQGLAAKYAGPKAQANANYLAGDIQKQRDMLNFQIASQRAQAAAGQAQQQQLQDAWARLMDGKGSPADEAIVGDKLQARIVDTPEGRAIAHSDDAAKDYRKDVAEIRPARDIVTELQAAAKALKFGTLNPKERGDMMARAELLMMRLPAAAAGVSRLNPGEMEIAKGVVSNPTDVLQFHEKAIGKLNALGDILDNRLRVSANTNLIRRAPSASSKADVIAQK